MNTGPTVYEKTVNALMAFCAGLAAGLGTALPVGFVVYFLTEASCSGEYMCGVGAAIWGMIAALAAGLIAYGVGVVLVVRRASTPGHRLGGVLTALLGVPLCLLAVFVVGSLA